MSRSPLPRIAVVGAGISGLATAWFLQSRSPENSIHLFDASDRIGGVIDTLHPRNDLLVECGADNFATLLPDALDLVREMNLEPEFITPEKNFRIAQVVRKGKLVPIPNGFSLMQPTRMGAILATPILSPAGKLRVLKEYFIPPRTSNDDESVQSFAIRRLGRECFERLVEPIVGGIFTAKADQLSMQAAMPQFLRMEKEHGGLIRAAFAKKRIQNAEARSAREASGARYDQFLAPKRGMQWWLQQLASPFNNPASTNRKLLLNHPIHSLQYSQNHTWLLNQQPYDQVCLALPSYAAATLIRSLATPQATQLASELDSIQYASSAIAVLAIRKDEIQPHALCFGSIAPAIEKRNALAISLSSEKYAGRCPKDTVLMRVFMGGSLRPDLLELNDNQLIEIAKQEVRELFGPSTTPSFQHLVRWNRAMPQYAVGHTQKVLRIRSLESQFHGLALTGNAYDGVGIPQCIRGAKLAAQRLLQNNS